MNDQISCQSLLPLLSEYVDEELREDLCQQIEAHIAECHNCRIVVDTIRKTISLYRRTASIAAEVPPEVRERLFRTLNLEDYFKG